MRAGTEELGMPQTEGEEECLPRTEIEEGMEERNKELVDRAKGPTLTAAEWNRLARCERP